MGRKLIETYYGAFMKKTFDVLFFFRRRKDIAYFIRDNADLLNRVPLRYIASYLKLLHKKR